MATRDSLIASNKWNLANDRPCTEEEIKYNDKINQMFSDGVSKDAIKRAIIKQLDEDTK